MRFILGSVFIVLCSPLFAADWEKVTDNLAKKEKAGYGGLCGISIDHSNGHIYLNVSDKGIYRSTDQGSSFSLFSNEVKGRTEWPGCMMFDPTGKTKKLATALVYGSPILLGDNEGKKWNVLDKKSSHVDWCAINWADLDSKFILAFKHESGGMLLLSNDAGQSFSEIGKGFSSAWVFDNKTAVAMQAKTKEQPEPKVMRTTDAGKSWTPIANFTTPALPQWKEGKLYWIVDGGTIITTTNKGETWDKLSETKEGKFGPMFGKSSTHLLVLGKTGILESIDEGKTWNKAIPLPADLKGWSSLTWFDYDPINDALYVMKMGSELYRMKRK